MRKLCILAFLVIISSGLSNSKENPDIEVITSCEYENGSWVGRFICIFPYTSDCQMSMHVQAPAESSQLTARRIDHDTHRENEELNSDCDNENSTSILRIVNMTYDDVQLYTCMQDTTEDTQWAWLKAYPRLEMTGNVSLGSQVKLTCTSFNKAPIFWVFPGFDTDNSDIITEIDINDENQTIIATFELQEKHNYAIFQCCMQLRNAQKTELPCDGYQFIVDDTVRLINYYENYQDLNLQPYIMTCIFQGNPIPDPQKIQWLACSIDDVCEIVNPTYFSSTLDEMSYTLNTTLLSVDISPQFVCSYDDVNHTFYPIDSFYGPEIGGWNKTITYSSSFTVVIDVTVYAFPTPDVTWTKTMANEQRNGSIVIRDNGHYQMNVVNVDNQYNLLFTIVNYDPAIDNQIYTCIVNNSMGQASIQIDTTDGPHSMSSSTGGNATMIWAACVVYSFPLPPPFTLRVLDKNEVTYNVQTVENDAEVWYEVNTSIAINTSTTYSVEIDCFSFNRFDYDERLSETRFFSDTATSQKIKTRRNVLN